MATETTISKAPLATQELFELAKKSRENAYCRYSGYQVGAAIRLADGRVFGGCNVENACYGATQCAERSAIQTAVGAVGGEMVITEVMVVTNASPPWPPCGMCRQVIAEFAKGAGTVIHTANVNGEYQHELFEKLFPRSFSSAQVAGK